MDVSAIPQRLDQGIIKELIDTVRQAASLEVMPRFRHLSASDVNTKQGPDDLVTVADKAAEAYISKRVREIMPGAAIVGEEAVADDPGLVNVIDTSEWCVIVDPIDGTSNYAHGIAVFGIILAVTYCGQTVFGLLYDPVMDDWVMASAGGGAFFCRPDAPPRALAQLPSPVVSEAHGYIALWLFAKHRHADLLMRYPQFLRISCLRCSCHEYRQMALGHAHFSVSPSPKPWDHAAGVLIMRELGGAGSVDPASDYLPGARDARALIAGVAGIQTQVRSLLFPV
ncbi:MAG: inositol monophosphatase [Granulosicoccus sp.]